jgi:hypothetical protein
VFCNASGVVDEKERDKDDDANDAQDNEQISKIRVTTCLGRLGRLHISVITRQIGPRTCHI